MGRLEGKVALISGGSRGQGAAEARAFVAEGAKVVVGDVLDDDGRALVAELGDDAVYVHLDVTDEALWANAVTVAIESFGHLDVLVNNAGIMRMGTIEELSMEDYDRVIAVNQTGCLLGMRAVVSTMKSHGSGSIINTSSISAYQGLYGMVAYTASKWAVRGMTKCAALELGHDRIRVNSIHPGTIDTPLVSTPEFEDVDKDAYFATQPIPRMGRPEEVAAVAVFLASEESSFCTGSEFVVDGGSLAGPAIAGLED